MIVTILTIAIGAIIYFLSKLLSGAFFHGVDEIENRIHEKKQREKGSDVQNLANIYGQKATASKTDMIPQDEEDTQK